MLKTKNEVAINCHFANGNNHEQNVNWLIVNLVQRGRFISKYLPRFVSIVIVCCAGWKLLCSTFEILWLHADTLALSAMTIVFRFATPLPRSQQCMLATISRK